MIRIDDEWLGAKQMNSKFDEGILYSQYLFVMNCRVLFSSF